MFKLYFGHIELNQIYCFILVFNVAVRKIEVTCRAHVGDSRISVGHCCPRVCVLRNPQGRLLGRSQN